METVARRDDVDGFLSGLESWLFGIILVAKDLVTLHIFVVTLIILIVGIRFGEFRADVQ